MKKIQFLLLLVFTLFGGFLMTSCDEDKLDAMHLQGEWQGDFKMYYDYEYRGRIYTCYSNNTNIVFYPSSLFSTHGTGRQVDYYASGPYEYLYYYFKWSINDGIITFDYPFDPEYNVSIDKYYIDSDVFTGRFPMSNSKFSLYKLVDYDWNSYNSYGNYYQYDRTGWNGYYAPQYESVPDTGNNVINTSEVKIIRRGIVKVN